LISIDESERRYSEQNRFDDRILKELQAINQLLQQVLFEIKDGKEREVQEVESMSSRVWTRVGTGVHSDLDASIISDISDVRFLDLDGEPHPLKKRPS
jgi:hypothetical protein